MGKKIILTKDQREKHDKLMDYISKHYPNCKELSFKEQDDILKEAMSNLKNI